MISAFFRMCMHTIFMLLDDTIKILSLFFYLKINQYIGDIFLVLSSLPSIAPGRTNRLYICGRDKNEWIVLLFKNEIINREYISSIIIPMLYRAKACQPIADLASIFPQTEVKDYQASFMGDVQSARRSSSSCRFEDQDYHYK